MMKIGLLIHDLDSEYSRSLCNGIEEYCKKNGHFFIVFAARTLKWPHLDYDYQHSIIRELIFSNSIDGLIVATATQSHYVSEEELSEYMHNFAPLPVVSIGYQFSDIPSIIVDCTSGIIETVEHLVKVHNKKKIALVTSLKGNPEAEARTQAFKQALKQFNIEENPNYIFDGDFTWYSSFDMMEKYYKEHNGFDFDSCMAINDDMAFGVMDFCNKVGVKIPQEMIIVGFDDSNKANIVPPLLSTINQQIEQQGSLAAQTVIDMINGKKVSMLQHISTKPKFRQTCGCIPLHDNRPQAIEADGSHVINKAFSEEMSAAWYYKKNQLSSVMHYTQTMQSDITVSELRQHLARDLKGFDISGAAVCLYEKPFETKKFQKMNLPELAYVISAFDNLYNFEMEQDSNYIFFNPNETIIPPGILSLASGKHIIIPLFHRHLQFGYLLFRAGNYDILIYEILGSSLSQIISNSVTYTQALEEKRLLEIHNKNLNEISKTDELTGLLNRRGFLAIGQQTISIAIDMKQSGLVIYGDMDGLKKINDTYGHDAGDRAIQKEAELLKKVFRASDVIARLGGDEFAIIAVGLTPNIFQKNVAKLEEECKKWNTDPKKTEAFDISISLGYSVFSNEEFALDTLLKLADKQQYKEKHRKKRARMESSI